MALHLPLLAQTKATNLSGSIAGTWKMTSQTAKDPKGQSFTTDLTKNTQYKIITPTHWMYVGYNSDSLKGGGDGGVYTLKGNKYIETLDGAKTDFTVKVAGDKYYQDGFIIYPDGEKLELHEIYQRVPEPKGKNADIAGTWNFVSGNDLSNGKKTPEKDMQELMIITPQHLMWVHKTIAGKFKEALVASYTREGNTITPNGIIASWPLGKEKVKVTATVKGDQMFSHVTVTMPDGKKEEFEAIHQNVSKPKLAKTASK
ncbi:hypothetical protein AAE02nite_29570 [Adhaeribacter aerolatus]|uniref:Lipocalin-like domain-containing protein n=2 Tax=Adhaeribacter aerolatus TaxID=670289 RepID=A0A512AZZ9_9BACT|nr:hypothetical protein AAE02nite_29570 [Adhaeribacter aerolatus]